MGGIGLCTAQQTATRCKGFCGVCASSQHAMRCPDDCYNETLLQPTLQSNVACTISQRKDAALL